MLGVLDDYSGWVDFTREAVETIRGLCPIFAALLFSSQLAQAQFTQQGPKLVGTGAVGNAFQGYSVALSADGNTAIVGGPTDNSAAGAAWVPKGCLVMRRFLPGLAPAMRPPIK